MEFNKIEKKWQNKWEKAKCFEVKENKKKKKYYVLEMYPYPSASYLHMGHVRNYTIGDVYARFKRMNGYNVLYPMGYDSFGLPAETAAKKEGIHPKKYTEDSIKKIMEYQKALGNSYAWSRVLSSHDVNYYKWNQYFFLKFYEKGLALRKKAPVNWCEECQSVLANEEAEGGKCWRCGNEVVKKDMEQWFFRITKYADRLLNDLSKIEWPEKIKVMQENWIGKSYGSEIKFKIDGGDWPVFTTRADTLYGVTFMVISAQHKRLLELTDKKYKKEVEDFTRRCNKARSQEEIEGLEKEGVFIGKCAIHPLTNEKIPVYAGNFVVADYGCGMVMGVPAHDQRDFEFAKKYKIAIKQVIAPNFVLNGENAPRKGSENLERRTVTTIIKHHKENKFLLVKEEDNTILVGGGIENGETPEEAISREIKEETGYSNFKIKERLMDNFYCYGFRKTKNKNQKTNDYIFFVELLDEKKSKSEADSGTHEIIWVKPSEVKNKITWEHHRFIWDFFENPKAYTGEGVLVNSDKFNNIESKKAIEEITKYLQEKSLGKKTVNYKIRDWMISRQRYWGTPIPIIYCDRCGTVPVNEKDLPVLLPEKVDFKARKTNPLATNKNFLNVKCTRCKGNARRETDTMGGFVDSSWYFLRYCDNKNKIKPFDKNKVNYWMPVDQYIGGAEHAVMHLIYARFFVKALKDLGFVSFDEPFMRLFNQGVLQKNGERMSKSKGNVVFQTEISDKYGIDTARFYLMFIASPDTDIEWNDKGAESTYKNLIKIYNLVKKKIGKSDKWLDYKINKTIKDVSENIENFKYNIALIKIMDYVDYLNNREAISKESLEVLAKIISPFTPHLAEEIWNKIGKKNFVSLAKWPVVDKKKISKEIEELSNLIENTKRDVRAILKIIKREPRLIKLVCVPGDYSKLNKEKDIFEKEFRCKVEIINVKKIKIEKKTKPGKPAIFIE